MRTAIAVVALFALACGGGAPRSKSAADAVGSYIAAVESNDPKGAYSLLSADVRRKMTFEQFRTMWQKHERERKLQAAALDEARKSRPDLGARAVVGYKDGKEISLSRESSRWHLDRALVGKVVAAKPRDAVRALTTAVQDADFAAFVAILSKRKREALVRMLSSFGTSLAANKEHFIQRIGEQRATMFWEDKAGRYRVTLVREDGEWRVDDFDIALRDEEEEDGDGEASSSKSRPKVKCDPSDPLCGL